MSDLRDILDRLEKLTGPDREVDGLIAKATGNMPAKAEYMAENMYGQEANQWYTGGYGHFNWLEPEYYTASLDAIVALIKQATGNASWRAGNTPSGRGFAFLGTSLKEHDGATPALALCIALLSALESGQ